MHTVRPLDEEAVLRAAVKSKRLMTIDEHNVVLEFGGVVGEVLVDGGASVPLYRHGIPDTFSLIGPPVHLYRHYGLDAEGIAERAEALIEDRVGHRPPPGMTAAWSS